MGSPFKKDSRPWKINEYLKTGKSLTKVEAIEKLKEYNLSQRIQDIKNTYIKYTKAKTHPIMVVYEDNAGGGGKRARYFYKGVGCPLESNPRAVAY